MIGALLAIAIGTAPALIARHVFLERPISKKLAIAILAPVFLVALALLNGTTLPAVVAVISFGVLTRSQGENESVEEEELEVVSWEEFEERTRDGRANQMNMDPYEGLNFECACGQDHAYSPLVMVEKELPNSKLVFRCPMNNARTCVQLAGWSYKQGFKSLFGARNPNVGWKQPES